VMPCRVHGNAIVCTRGGPPRDREIVERHKEWLRLSKGNRTQLSFEEWLKKPVQDVGDEELDSTHD